MHAHTHLSHKYTYTNIYIYTYTFNAYIYIRIHAYIRPVFPARSYTHTRGHPCMRVPTRLCTRRRAHRRRRRTQRPAPHRRPAERVLPEVARRRAGKAAHTAYNVVTDAVFHAPMFALNAFADSNACEPSHPRSTPTERARMCRRGCVCAQSHTHTHTDAYVVQSCM